MSVQFDELSGFKPHHFGLLSELWGDRYPETEFKPPLPSIVELYGVHGTQRAEVVVADSEFPVGRYWYLSEDHHRLIQVQPDKFVLNWRKLDAATEYPSYEVLREDFTRELDSFLEFVTDHNIGEFDPKQAELTYVNHILVEGSLSQELPRLISPWSGRVSEPFVTDPEDWRLKWQYRFDEQQKPIGRLHVQIQTGLRTSDQRPVLTLQLTGRGAPTRGGREGVLDFTDKAHEWIVRGFASLTTEQAHKLWERQQ